MERDENKIASVTNQTRVKDSAKRRYLVAPGEILISHDQNFGRDNATYERVINISRIEPRARYFEVRQELHNTV